MERGLKKQQKPNNWKTGFLKHLPKKKHLRKIWTAKIFRKICTYENVWRKAQKTFPWSHCLGFRLRFEVQFGRQKLHNFLNSLGLLWVIGKLTLSNQTWNFQYFKIIISSYDLLWKDVFSFCRTFWILDGEIFSFPEIFDLFFVFMFWLQLSFKISIKAQQPKLTLHVIFWVSREMLESNNRKRIKWFIIVFLVR